MGPMPDLSPRFTKPRNSLDLDISLCPSCRVVNFTAILESIEAGQDLNGTIVAQVGTTTSGPTADNCRLCSFLRRLMVELNERTEDRYKAEIWKLCVYDSWTARGLPRPDTKLACSRSIVFSLLPRPGDIRCFEGGTDAIFPITCSADSKPETTLGLYRGRKLKTSTINHELLMEWLQDCVQGHDRCRLNSIRGKPIKVIDCLQRKVIYCPQNAKYFALSYAWGEYSSASKPLRLPEGHYGLSDIVPPIVSDAMSLVVSLGFRYLWVDCFCIDQENLQEIHQEISQMDQIYEGALATFVVTAKRAVQQGIPGVSTSRTKLGFVQISKQLSLQAPGRLRESLATTDWNRRAWTYQEFALSRRCLILADDQVHFVCKTGMTCEGVREAVLGNLPYNKRRCLDPNLLETDDIHEEFEAPQDPPFLRHLTAYTGRQLRYERDRLDAFRGILSRSELLSYWGVPIYRTSIVRAPILTSAQLTGTRNYEAFNMGFLFGLCWKIGKYAKDCSSKLPKFPSWSWVSTRGSVEYTSDPDEGGDLWVDVSDMQTAVEVFLDDPVATEGASVLQMSQILKQPSGVIPERSMAIYLKGIGQPIQIKACSQFRHLVRWDCEPNSEEETFLGAILILTHCDQRAQRTRTYLIVKMDGNTARRVGLATGVGIDEESLPTISEVDIVKLM